MKMITKQTCRTNPWTELDRLFEQAFPYEQQHAARSIPVRFHSTEDAQVMELELPGVNKKDINLSYENGILSVEATRTLHRGETDKELKYHQSIRIGTEFDFKNIDAHLANGILSITLPRKEEDKPFRVTVN